MADLNIQALDIRDGSLADICTAIDHVCFGPILLQKSAIREQSDRSDLLMPLRGIRSGGAAVLRLLD
jgi:hypothetical protein